MPSPFPGMDPYLEDPDRWPDFHGNLLYKVRAALVPQLPENYSMLVDRYVWLHEPDAETRQRGGRPDMGLVGEGDPSPTVSGATASLTAPERITLAIAPRPGNRYIRIVDRRDRRLVTVIELVSPANKTPGSDRQDYLAKRNEYLTAGVNLVEIDLLRGGQRLPLSDPPPQRAYYAMVCRSRALPHAEFWGFTLRDVLPSLPIPLGTDEQDMVLTLKPCLDAAYDEGGYAREIDYSQPPTPPLMGEDAAWARQLLQTARNGAQRPEPPSSAE